MKNLRLLTILFFANFLFISTAFANWPQGKNKGYLKLFQWWVIADQHYTGTGQIDPNLTNGIFNTGLYAEYGFTDRLTGIVYFPFYSRAYFNNSQSRVTGDIIQEGEAINSIGDTDISLLYNFYKQNDWYLSATLTLGLPLGESAGGTQGNLQTGDGEFNQLIRVDLNKSYQIGKVNTFYTAYAGYNNRSNGFSDELRYGVEAGGGFFDNSILGIVRLTGIKSLFNGDSNDPINSTSLFANNSELITISPEIAYNITPNFGVSATGAYALYGRIIFANPSYAVGVHFTW